MGHENLGMVLGPEGLKFGFLNSFFKQAAQLTDRILDFTDAKYNVTTSGLVHAAQYNPPLSMPVVCNN
jgi:hypothetical protein